MSKSPLKASNPLQEIYKEPRSEMESPSTYPVSYAIAALDFSTTRDGWKKSRIFQLFPTNQRTKLNPNSDFKNLNFGNDPGRDLRQLHSQLTNSALTGLPEQEQYEYVKIVNDPFGSKTGAPTDVLFAIVPRDSAVDSRNDKNSTFNDRGPTRGFFRPDKDISTVSRRAGIIIETYASGDDLILPNGPGGQFGNTPVNDAKFRYYKVDRNRTFVNTNDGDDAIIGGFSTDFFGPGKPSDLLQAKLNPLTFRANTSASGSKVYIGGSESDLLIGGRDADYLVGDSFATLNEPAPFLIKSPAANNYITTRSSDGGFRGTPVYNLADLPATQRRQIKSFQPEYFYNQSSLGASQERHSPYGGRSGYGVGNSDYPMWIPGNDVIFGGDGNDTIFGDDNTKLGSGSNLLPLVVMKRWGQAFNAKDGNHVLKQDEINSGVTWPFLFKANAEKGTLGSDFIHAGLGTDYIQVGFGQDAIIGGGGGDIIDLGAQIAAQGYTPFFGTKVAFGDDATFDPILKKWIKAPSAEKSVDNFIVGDIYFDESELGVGSSLPSPMKSERETFLDALTSMNAVNNIASKGISAIPGYAKLINQIFEASFTIMKLFAPPAPDYSKATNSLSDASDKISVIRDFDPFDTFTIRTKSGDILSTSRNSNVAFAGKSKLFDGNGNQYVANGTKVQQSITNNGQVVRLFLEDYHDSLFVLGSNESELTTNGITQKYTTWTIGGSAYGGLADTNYSSLN